MERWLARVAASLAAAVWFAVALGCNSQTGTAWSPFGPPTIPPPSAAQGPDANGYYPSPFVTPPPGTTAPGATPTFQPSSPLPANGVGQSGTQSSSASSDGLSWQTPRSGSSTPLVATRGASISRAAIANPTRTAEEPIRIVEAAPAASSARGVVEISQLPKPRTSLGPIPAVPAATAPAATTPATSRTRGFIPALPQQTEPASGVPANSPPPAGASPATARPRFSSSAPAARYDAAVVPAGYTQSAEITPETDPPLRWRRR